jgi:hypothetical protein
MMRRSLIHSLGAAALMGIAPLTAHAQASDSAASAATTPATRWDAHPVGRYKLEMTIPERTMQVDLTIADSAGKAFALFWPVGDNDGHTMNVTVKGTDLVLDAETPRGPVQIVLQRQGDRITGSWAMGADKGPVQGRVER